MRVLIVEDDLHKQRRLLGELQSMPIVRHVDSVSSLQQAMSMLELARFDLVFLDMAIPSHAGDAGSTDIYSQPVGGLDILLHLSLTGRDEAVIVVTQYPTVEYNREHVPLDKLIGKLAEDDVKNVRGAIRFDEDNNWRMHLRKFVEGSP
jgi:CheY-like chemotaxis protein